MARAAARTGVTVVQSTLSTAPVEDLAPAMGDTPGFFQLYTPKDRDLALSLIRPYENLPTQYWMNFRREDTRGPAG